MSQFRIGDRIKINQPGRAEHGATCTVARIKPIEDCLPGILPRHHGKHAYAPVDGWWLDGELFWSTNAWKTDLSVVAADEDGSEQKSR